MSMNILKAQQIVKSQPFIKSSPFIVMVLDFLVAAILEICKFGAFHPQETWGAFSKGWRGYIEHITLLYILWFSQRITTSI